MKRIAAILLTAVLAMTATACSGIKPLISFSSPAKETEEQLIYPDEENYAMGYLGDTLRTSFFDMTVDSAYTCREFDGITAEDGYKLLVAEITLYNYTDVTQPMFFTDFEIWWDDQEGEGAADYDFPLYIEEEQPDGSSEFYNVSGLQLPIEYDLSIHETRTGTLLYQVPEASKTFSIAFTEYFSDDSVGALFEVRFSAPMRE